MRRFTCLLAGVSLAALTSSAIAEEAAKSSADDQGIQEVIVTAQKRSESANKVGMSIVAVQADTLVKQNIVAPSDLQKVVPGFTYTDAPRGAPVFAIRGIGFDDSTVGSASTVALYLDEVPMSFPMEARFPTLDLERVEVLKGPQGILFGQNSTAGAINFIAAKPTNELRAGFDASYGRFNTLQLSGFVSGRVNDKVRVRVSGTGTHADGWQYNYQRPGETLGAKRSFAGRVITEWTPTDDLKVTFNLNGWSDRSDTQAAQLLNAFPLQANFPYVPYDLQSLPPHNARAAGWDRYLNTNRLPASVGKQEKLKRDDSFYQGSIRADYHFTEELTLTSITAYSHYHQNYGLDVDGTQLSNFSIGDTGKAESFNQEIRLAGDFKDLRFIVGGNYSRDRTSEFNRYYVDQSSVFVGFVNNTDSGAFFRQPIEDIAVFGNVEYQPIERVTLHAGLRWTQDKRSYEGCTQDYGDGVQANAFNVVIPLLNAPGSPPPNIQPGGCTSSNVLVDPVVGQYFHPGLASFKLKEANLSWRAGVDFQATQNTLIYANVSKGFKSGGFPAVNVASNFQLGGVKQESVLAYEAGVKAGLFGRRLQVNLAGFYDDYHNKQLRGRILDPFGFFGVLDKLLNIPKSRVYGAELQLQAAPVDGLLLNVGATYTNTRVTKDFFAYDPVGNLINYNGLRFPHTPEWNITASADYEKPITDKFNGFVGVSMLYQSETMGLFARPSEISTVLLDPTLKPGVTVPGDSFRIKAYTTVDMQIGIADPEGRWRVWIWGKNILNTYYWTNATQSFDSIYRLTAMPVTYGGSVSFRF